MRSESKANYDRTHPVIAFRISLEEKQRLHAYLRQRGISLSDFVVEALDKMEMEEVVLTAYNELNTNVMKLQETLQLLLPNYRHL
jgi:predicted DNA-binding protein